MFPGTHAVQTPDKPAIIAPASGRQVTYRELDENSTRIAHYLHDELGLRPGDVVAMVTDNDLRAFDVYWAAIRSGLYITAINHHLTAAETNFILTDCGAKALFASANVAGAVADSDEIDALAAPGRRVAWAGPLPGFADYNEVLAASSPDPLTDQPRGTDMLYSSGTTGRPKGIKPPLPTGQVDEVPDLVSAVFGPVYGFDADTVYLSPAPVYHAAPLRYCGMVNSLGGTTVLMDRFDAETALRYIQEYRITHSQWVPTMFVRMLKLPPEARARYDVSSMKAAIHAAAPCPAEVKRAMIDWWGPVVNEYYAATEAAGVCLIGAQDALTHPGSVGKAALGVVHICDDDGNELPAGEVGTIYFERDEVPFTYHNDPDKTRKSQHPHHETWATTGDLGYVDEEGFVYLTDRSAFMIISGGVNIYPQESENVLISHPAVYDVAVIGVPDDEMGEQVKACVQLSEGYVPSEELAAELIDYAKASLAAYKAPRSVDFLDDLPRTPTGKMVKGELRKRYLRS
ncbi:putative fatty-acid--CoA ligase [Gordonia araii NBRC 100433]|uniref:Putative fatty-acid--CoA ligase n=1 Tax=Gordonia araii NBRC 100433 TaxID=1073574 RepID=G7H5M2_9ACTN|nr:acyl-CoA synthetase [Gordonia araii]NNG95859.1 acyl-CoA synthetase [Gordonia araii NBRC 100433]GAB11147.1 putative fatty-acid--CoA ligase [Gordonia araii NBRC 100433]